MQADDQQLPQKEAGMFKQIIKFYEGKQYKKALKTADQILKKFPNHGETLSMKGLTLSGLEKKEDAYALVKQGLTKSKCKSHVCWHVFGLLHRSDKNYDQAIKCYRNALNIDPDNLQILRDLSLMQVQRMDTNGLVVTRHKLLQLKPSQKQNWLGFALAHHLDGNHELALRVLEKFNTVADGVDNKYETSELILYQILILTESGDHEGAMKCMEDEAPKILDKVGVLEAKARCLIAMDRTEEAHQVFLKLLQIHSENKASILGYLQTGGCNLQELTDPLDDAAREAALRIVEELEERFPKSQVIKRASLDLCVGENFAKRLVSFVKPYLRKTIPSLFSALKSVYRCPEKVAVMDTVFAGWEESLKTSQTFGDEEGTGTELPSTYLWVLMLMAAHFYRKADYDRALEFINQAIDHTPTIEMLYILKGRIHKHRNDLDAAWEAVEKARTLDTADRYLNTKSTKYLLRCNRIRDADSKIALFTTQPDDVPNYNTVVDMQCMWYELEEGDAYRRLGDILTALKRWLLVDKHFSDMEEDQFDFHTYCLRKVTMRAYIDFLRYERRHKRHAFYQNAARRVVQGYLDVYDRQKAGEDLQALVIADATGKLPIAEGEPPVPAAAKEKDAKDNKDDSKEITLNLEDPLGATLKFVEALLEHSGDDVTTHLLACEVYLRRGKPLLVVRHAFAAKRLNIEAATLQSIKDRLAALVGPDTPEAVREVVGRLSGDL